MTITPIFHFTCHHCGKAFDLTGKRESFTDESASTIGEYIINDECDVTFDAKCLDDTCKDCMSIVYAAQAKERDFRAERDLS